MAKNRKLRRDENAKILALFWRRDYFVLCPLLICLLFKLKFLPPLDPLLLFIAMFIIYGIWTIIIAVQWRRHFVYGMQHAARRRMGYYRAETLDKKMQREGIIIGIVFILIGLCLIVAVI